MANASFLRGWDRRLTDSELVKKPSRNNRLLPLVDISLQTLARHVEEASAEALKCLPVKLLCRLYEEVTSRGMTFQAWKLFSYILPKHASKVPLGVYSFYRQIDDPVADDLSVYTGPLTSPNVDFITRLHIDRAWTFKANELLILSDMANLGVLILLDRWCPRGMEQHHTSASSISDRLVRGWSEKDNPFPNLRLLKIIAPSTITVHSLRYASRFPSLTNCYLGSDHFARDKVAMKVAQDLGWNFHRVLPQDQQFVFSTEDQLLANPEVTLSPYTKTAGNGQSSQSEHEPTENWYTGTGLPTCSPNGLIAMARLEKWSSYLSLGNRIDNVDLVYQNVPLQHRASIDMAKRGSLKSHDDSILPLPPKPLASIQLNYSHESYQEHIQTRPVPCVFFIREYNPTMSCRSDGGKSDRGSASEQGKRQVPAKRGRPTLKRKAETQQSIGGLIRY